MNLENLWAEIEAEQAWRIDEIRFFQNQLVHLTDEGEKERFRRALVLLLYAHFEGFCKFALLHYVSAVNSTGITCREANNALVAASLAEMFQELRNPDKKSSIFRADLPDDAKLHRFARDREFVERAADFYSTNVNIPDGVVDTESNLKPIVLRKNLYRLGFQHDQFETIEGKIHWLLEDRNKISHGELKSGVQVTRYEKLREAAFLIMNTIKSDVMRALENKEYLRPV
jgi:hypothetical protein